jgi:putative ABC transport system substrate-binding protein
VITRRNLVVALGACTLTAPLFSIAQPQSGKIARLGYLSATTGAGTKRYSDALRAGLRDIGYIEGRHYVFEFRWAEGNNDRLPGLAAELVARKVDIIMTNGVPATRAAKQATSEIPIVTSVGDAVGTGLVASESRPGGNVTGLSSFAPEIGAKRMELLREAFPRIQRIAVLWNSSGAGVPLPAMEVAAKSLKLELQKFGVRKPDEFESAFASMHKNRVEAVVIVEDPMMLANPGAAVELANRYRIPSIGFLEVADAGGLMAYGTNSAVNYRRTAIYVDKLLKGSKPADLPIERAMRFELIVSQKTAKALGIKVPQSILIRADKVIE